MAERPSEAPIPANRGSVAGNYKYRKALCKNFQSTGKCHYGDTCKFSHNTCKFNFKRSCPYGEKCVFWHTESDYNAETREGNRRSRKRARRQCTNLMTVDVRSHGSVSSNALGQEGSSSSAPVLASESENAQTAPMPPKTLVNAEVQNPLRPTASKHELSPRQVSSFKWKRPKKFVGIYADWIDEESSVPGSASGSQQ